MSRYIREFLKRKCSLELRRSAPTFNSPAKEIGESIVLVHAHAREIGNNIALGKNKVFIYPNSLGFPNDRIRPQ